MAAAAVRMVHTGKTIGLPFANCSTSPLASSTNEQYDFERSTTLPYNNTRSMPFPCCPHTAFPACCSTVSCYPLRLSGRIVLRRVTNWPSPVHYHRQSPTYPLEAWWYWSNFYGRRGQREISRQPGGKCLRILRRRFLCFDY